MRRLNTLNCHRIFISRSTLSRIGKTKIIKRFFHSLFLVPTLYCGHSIEHIISKISILKKYTFWLSSLRNKKKTEYRYKWLAPFTFTENSNKIFVLLICGHKDLSSVDPCSCCFSKYSNEGNLVGHYCLKIHHRSRDARSAGYKHRLTALRIFDKLTFA